MNLFWRDGYGAVSASDLAEAMGIGRSSFYNAFGEREAVFREALVLYGRDAPDRRLSELAPDEPVAPAIVGLFREVCRVRSSDPEARGCLVCNSVAELAPEHPSLGPLLEGIVQERVRLFTRLLQRAARSGELGELEDPRGAAHAMVAFLLGLNTVSKVVRSERALWRMCRAFLNAFGIPT